MKSLISGSHLMGVVLGEPWQQHSLSDSRWTRRRVLSCSCSPLQAQDQLSPCQQLLTGRHAADLRRVLGPGLEVLQGVQGAVLQTQRVGGHRLVDGLLEGLLLQLHEDAVGLLPLCLALLCRLPPAATRRARVWNRSEPDPFKTGERV